MAEEKNSRHLSVRREVRKIHPNRDNEGDSSTKRTSLMDEIAEEKRAGMAEIESEIRSLKMQAFKKCEDRIKEAARNQKSKVIFRLTTEERTLYGLREAILTTVNSRHITVGKVADEVVEMLVAKGLEAKLLMSPTDPYIIENIEIKF